MDDLFWLGYVNFQYQENSKFLRASDDPISAAQNYKKGKKLDADDKAFGSRSQSPMALVREYYKDAETQECGIFPDS